MGNPTETTQSADTVEALKQKVEELEKANKNLETRFKDTQSAFSKGQLKIKTLETQNKMLAEQAMKTIQSGLSNEELEELKLSDPDKWYAARRNQELEAQKQFNDSMSEATQRVVQDFEREQNRQLLAAFKQRNPHITDEYINDEIPLKLKRALDEGAISFQQFLGEVESLCGKGRTVGGLDHSVNTQPNMSYMGNAGGVVDTASNKKSLEELYKTGVL